MSGRRRVLRRVSWIGAVAVAVGLSVPPADAELRVLEVVGAVPLSEATARPKMPKERAIDEALFEGVSRVAEEFILEAASGAPPPADQRDRVRRALGPDMVPYTRSFRIVEDQGEQPALFTEDPDAATEYVVVVSVQVETERIREQLVRSGLLVDEARGVLRGYEVQLEGLNHYGGYAALIDFIQTEAVGVTAVTPREINSNSVLLDVQAEFGPEVLLERMRAAAPPALEIHGGDSRPDWPPKPPEDQTSGRSPLARPRADPGRADAQPPMRIEVRWRPLSEAAAAQRGQGALP